MSDSSNQLNFSQALETAVRTPGAIMEAYSAFHNYSIGNQILALIQCRARGIQSGPIKTFKGWQAHGRFVKKGERALILCMPITFKHKGAETEPGGLDPDDAFTTAFVYKPRWFVLSQTDGQEFELPTLPTWNAETALKNLNITQVPFIDTDGNSQGYARGREIAINPVAQMPHKTFFHETAHCDLGHTTELDFNDTARTPRNLREVEAESVALLCCEALNLDGATYCRGYIQNWLNGDSIPEASARKIFGSAERILKAGRIEPAAPETNEEAGCRKPNHGLPKTRTQKRSGRTDRTTRRNARRLSLRQGSYDSFRRQPLRLRSSVRPRRVGKTIVGCKPHGNRPSLHQTYLQPDLNPCLDSHH
jgi:hypothetical protein